MRRSAPVVDPRTMRRAACMNRFPPIPIGSGMRRRSSHPGWAERSALCMDSRFFTFKSALNRSADSMARTLPTTTAAFSLLPSWSNSIARFFAPTVRCSICDEDVASVRSNTALMGPNVWTCSPRWCTAVSNCASVTEASSISAMSGAGTSRVRSLSVIGTADSYGPLPRDRRLRDTGPPRRCATYAKCVEGRGCATGPCVAPLALAADGTALPIVGLCVAGNSL